MPTTISISDATLREQAANGTFSFKEKIEIAKYLDKLNVDVIETPPVSGRTDVIFLHSIAPLCRASALCVPCALDEASVKAAYDAVGSAAKVRLQLRVPSSTVQMEYLLHKKPAAVLELIAAVTAAAKACTNDVEVAFLDATRADDSFFHAAVEAAVKSGASVITVCDTAGEMLPGEFAAFITALYEAVPSVKDVCVSVECSDALGIAAACAVSCVKNGVTQIKTAVGSRDYPSLADVAHLFRAKSDALGVSTGINMTTLDNTVGKIASMIGAESTAPRTASEQGTETEEEISLCADDDKAAVANAVAALGYELGEDDLLRVFNEVSSLAAGKHIGAHELDAVIASVAMQAEPTYTLRSYVINSSNLISPTAQIELERDGRVLAGFHVGDGPIDAAFRTIEQITGHHYDLDDFQIQTLTEGREAIGSCVIKLRSEGKLYSGKGISTDILGASIRAYVAALNKICFEEAEG